MKDPAPVESELRWYLRAFDAPPGTPRDRIDEVHAHPLGFECETAEGVAAAVAHVLGWQSPTLVMQDEEPPDLRAFVCETPNGPWLILAKRLPRSEGRPADPAERSRERAEKYLSLARKYDDAGFTADAVVRLEVILSEHAETPAAVAARELLQSIRDRTAGGARRTSER